MWPGWQLSVRDSVRFARHACVIGRQSGGCGHEEICSDSRNRSPQVRLGGSHRGNGVSSRGRSCATRVRKGGGFAIGFAWLPGSALPRRLCGRPCAASDRGAAACRCVSCRDRRGPQSHHGGLVVASPHCRTPRRSPEHKAQTSARPRPAAAPPSRSGARGRASATGHARLANVARSSPPSSVRQRFAGPSPKRSVEG